MGFVKMGVPLKVDASRFATRRGGVAEVSGEWAGVDGIGTNLRMVREASMLSMFFELSELVLPRVVRIGEGGNDKRGWTDRVCVGPCFVD